MTEGFHQKEAFKLTYNVSRETMSKFEKYEDILKASQKKFNLIGKSTENKIWARHFYDSAFSCKFVLEIIGRTEKKKLSLVDVGSGAGFPGLVIALMCQKISNVSFTLIESNKKKASFLECIVSLLGLKVKVINSRAEEQKKKFDLITARAVAPLNKLVKLVCKISKKNSRSHQDLSKSPQMSANVNKSQKQLQQISANLAKLNESHQHLSKS